MEEIMNVGNAWDERTEMGEVEGPMKGVTRKEVKNAMNKIRSGKAAGSLEVSMEMIRALLLAENSALE